MSTRQAHALNVNTYAEPQLGDDILAYGFGDTANVWKGTLAGIQAKGNDSAAVHWEELPKVGTGEYIVQAAQHQGQSGGPAVNGCGYVGLAHAAE